jgi:2-succinyl-6-hydroxy-2,4-cyclohexadiene-1-carboxylate synthase
MVFVPGFTQTAAIWDAVRGSLPASLDTVALELPDGLDYTATAAALGAAGGQAVYVGYSLGGRLCLALALARPDLVEALVLVSASPGIEDEPMRAARRAADEELARSIERDGADAFLERWLAQPLFATLPRTVAGAAARLGAGHEAQLAHQLRALGQGVQPAVWERLEELTMPVALLTGLADTKYDAIAEAMFDRIDDCLHLRLEGGHSLPLEQPRAVARALESFAHDVSE